MKRLPSPKCGEVYNLGGGRQNSISILETIDLLSTMGLPVRYQYEPSSRKGDPICYTTDLNKLHSHFPGWEIRYNLDRIASEIVDSRSRLHSDASEAIGTKHRL